MYGGVGEDEGTGGDVSNQYPVRSTLEYGYLEEGAVAVGGGVGEDEEGDD